MSSSTATHIDADDLPVVLDRWLHDVQSLLGSMELNDALSSTFHLITTAFSKGIGFILFPIEVLHSTAHNLLVANASRDETIEVRDTTEQHCSSGNMFDLAGRAFPMVVSVACQVKDDICNSVVCLLGMQSAGECSSEASNSGRTNEKGSTLDDTSSECASNSRVATSHFMRSFDLDICEQELTSESTNEAVSTDVSSQQLQHVELVHDEHHNHITVSVIDELVKTGACIVLQDDILHGQCHSICNASCPCWKAEGSTARLMKTFVKDSKRSIHDGELLEMLERETLVWSGNMKNCSGDNKGYAPKAPWFKSRGIVSGCSPLKLATTLLDSSQVGKYNKHSQGRDDVKVMAEGIDTVHGILGHGETKIVESSTKIPFTGSVLTMKTLIHARPLHLVPGFSDEAVQDRTSYIIVSRSVSDAIVENFDKNEVIWGINLLRCVEGDSEKTDLTTVTYVSSNVPLMLQHKVGVMSCYDFFKNIRDLMNN